MAALFSTRMESAVMRPVQGFCIFKRTSPSQRRWPLNAPSMRAEPQMIQGLESEPLAPIFSSPRVSTARDECAVMFTSINSIGA